MIKLKQEIIELENKYRFLNNKNSPSKVSETFSPTIIPSKPATSALSWGEEPSEPKFQDRC